MECTQLSFYAPPKIGEYVATHGRRIYAAEMGQYIGRTVIQDKSTEHKTWLQRVLLLGIFDDAEDGPRLVWNSGSPGKANCILRWIDGPIKFYEED